MKNRHRKTIISSLLLHTVLFLLLGFAYDRNLFVVAPAQPENPDPIVFELQDNRRDHELVETSEDAELPETPDDARLASDRNAMARNDERDALTNGDPFSRGDIQFRELDTPRQPIGKPITSPESNEPSPKDTKSEIENDTGPSDFYAGTTSAFREYLLDPEYTDRVGAQERMANPRYDNQATGIENMGALSFNTYNWNFAPYMLALKRKVERNVFPPPAFTRLGMIDGETLLRFRIYPDGKMTQLHVIEYKGHHTLKETSVRAIEVSDPFPQLPDDFPEEYLEVTARFSYFINKSYPRRKER